MTCHDFCTKLIVSLASTNVINILPLLCEMYQYLITNLVTDDVHKFMIAFFSVHKDTNTTQKVPQIEIYH